MRQFLDTHITNWLSEMAYDMVDWEAIGDALEMESPLFKLWALKQVSKFCGVGKQMHQMGLWSHDHCPCCNALGETTRHLLQCPVLVMQQSWQEGFEALEQWMLAVDMEPNIWKCVIFTLLAGKLSQFVDVTYGEVKNKAWDQDLIGWENFVEGKITKSWA